MVVSIPGGEHHRLELGLVDTSDGGWTGEDCVWGYETPDGDTITTCHALEEGTCKIALQYNGDPLNLQPGQTTFNKSFEGQLTYYVSLPVDLGGDGQCFVGGADPSYYDGLYCVQL
jgi:hypothetical protein